ncbi:acyl-CoA dehydrogenase family protein [Saccharopolyspora sp. HNM0983]|uniref:Acyl-CoA dehydrogenase family protein n=1 Tax=Saccharopolyspora montiporae TaxID=2781240 RepID=A0A929B991_9PSEU|nr:acyl-CoA dehydrogenase family protein [Saccharopolyspora sp. HNM0983]MBE9374611.1 acyl-CoA dehydrogenase family protein [Saccharopolyspora sp. HNM0983]
MSTPDDPDALRAEVRGWLAQHHSADLDRREWLSAVVDRGYAVPRWPADAFGLGLPDELARVVEEEFRRADAPGSGQDRLNLWAGTVLAYGSADMRARFLRPLLLGELNMCLLYSEPGAGSDLAGVRTRAVRDGDGFLVDGQKVWTSHAAQADYGMLVARTDPGVPKHEGISFFFLPMHQDGVQVRPLRQMTGERHFNEVFLTGARVPAANMLGEPGQGWRVLQTALAYERVMLGETNRGASTRSAKQGSGDADLVELARSRGKFDDPVLRQDIARVLMLRQVNRWNGRRADSELAAGTSSPLVSLGKLVMSRLLHETGRVQSAIAGPEAMLEGEGNPEGDDANFAAMNAFFTSIGGGTDQIQRNIIGERVLGLPKEPDPYRGVAFEDVPRSG